MKTHKIFIRFGLISKRLNQKGCAAIQCRITYNKNRKDFATGLFINPDHWDPKKQRLLDQSDQEETTNMQLSLIENKISKAFLMLQVKEEPLQVQDIYDAYKGKTLEKELGILEVWEMDTTNGGMTIKT